MLKSFWAPDAFFQLSNALPGEERTLESSFDELHRGVDHVYRKARHETVRPRMHALLDTIYAEFKAGRIHEARMMCPKFEDLCEKTGRSGSADMAAASHVFAYDFNGNVRRSLGTYRALDAQGVAAASNTIQDYWYRYDFNEPQVYGQGRALARGALIVARDHRRRYRLSPRWDPRLDRQRAKPARGLCLRQCRARHRSAQRNQSLRRWRALFGAIRL